MSEVRKRKLELKTKEFEPPEKKIVSDADIFIKKLSENQLNTKVTLESQLSHEKQFTKSTELVPLSNYLPGTSSLDNFQNNVKQVEQIEEFLAAGLSERDVELYLGSLNGDAYLLQKYKKLESSIMKQRLSEIDKLLERHDRKLITRSEEKVDAVECEVVKQESTKTKLMKFALNNQKLKSKSVLPHPLDELKQIEEVKFGHLKDETINPNINKIRRKARKLFNRIKSLHDIDNLFGLYKKKVPRLLNKRCSDTQTKWDVTEKVDETIPVVEKKVYTCKPHNYYTIKNKQIVKLGEMEPGDKDLDVVKKLNFEEIKLLPKFKNYHPGSPSKTLYLKNLTNSIKEDDLKTLFQNYKSDVEFRILKGKMRGQAFATFSDVNTAERALKEVNGTFIKNKPVIIEFGKGSD